MEYNEIIKELEDSSKGYFGDGGFEAERLSRLKSLAELKLSEKSNKESLKETMKANKRMFIGAITTAVISGILSLIQIVLNFI